MYTPWHHLIEPHGTSVWVGLTVVSIIVWANLALEVTSLHKANQPGELCMGLGHVINLSVAHIISTFVYWLRIIYPFVTANEAGKCRLTLCAGRIDSSVWSDIGDNHSLVTNTILSTFLLPVAIPNFYILPQIKDFEGCKFSPSVPDMELASLVTYKLKI